MTKEIVAIGIVGVLSTTVFIALYCYLLKFVMEIFEMLWVLKVDPWLDWIWEKLNG